MSLCSSSCGGGSAVPRFPTGCVTEQRKGGIPNLIFMACNVRFAGDGETSIPLTTPSGSIILVGKITDYTSWALLVQNNMVRISPEGLGDKPESSYTLERVSSCKPEQIASETHVINFQSKQMDTDNLYDRTYWQTVRTNFNKYRIVYIDCNDIIYWSGDPEDPGFEFTPTQLGYIMPQVGETDNAYYQVNLSFVYGGIPDMVEVPNIEEAFTIDVNT